jgi:hypothetical protein
MCMCSQTNKMEIDVSEFEIEIQDSLFKLFEEVTCNCSDYLFDVLIKYDYTDEEIAKMRTAVYMLMNVYEAINLETELLVKIQDYYNEVLVLD